MAMNINRVLSSYHVLGVRAYEGLKSVANLDWVGVQDLLRYIVLRMSLTPILLACHVLYVALVIRRIYKGREFWLKSLMLTIFGSFGGSTLTHTLLGEPAPLFTSSSNLLLGYGTMAWWVVEVFPLLGALFELRLFGAALTFMAVIAKGRTVLGSVDKVIEMGFKGGVGAGAVILGGLAGTGGLLIIAVERKLTLGKAAGRSPFSEPGWGFKSPYLIACIYYLVVDPQGWLRNTLGLKLTMAKDVAKFWLIFGLATHAAVEILINRMVNPFYVVERLLYTISRVSPKNRGVRTESDDVQPSKGDSKERTITLPDNRENVGTLRRRRKMHTS